MENIGGKLRESQSGKKNEGIWGAVDSFVLYFSFLSFFSFLRRLDLV